MIYYNSRAPLVGFSDWGAFRATRIQRAFWVACMFAVPMGIVGVAAKILDNYFNYLPEVMPDASLYGNFLGVMGFLLTFRTMQAYGRFREGTAFVHHQTADFLDATCLLLSLSRASKATADELREFHRIVIRLVSCLNAACFADLEDNDSDEDKTAWRAGVLDFDGLDDSTVELVQSSLCKPECVMQILQNLISVSLNSTLKDVPPPLLTRVFQELGAGMIKYHEATKLVHVPFPFPIVAVTECTLIAFSLFTPMTMAALTAGPLSSGTFTVFFTFFFWGLHSLAGELDNPFQSGPNNLDLKALQDAFNLRLVSLQHHALLPCAQLSDAAVDEGFLATFVQSPVFRSQKSNQRIGSVLVATKECEPRRQLRRFLSVRRAQSSKGFADATTGTASHELGSAGTRNSWGSLPSNPSDLSRFQQRGDSKGSAQSLAEKSSNSTAVQSALEAHLRHTVNSSAMLDRHDRGQSPPPDPMKCSESLGSDGRGMPLQKDGDLSLIQALGPATGRAIEAETHEPTSRHIVM